MRRTSEDDEDETMRKRRKNSRHHPRGGDPDCLGPLRSSRTVSFIFSRHAITLFRSSHHWKLGCQSVLSSDLKAIEWSPLEDDLYKSIIQSSLSQALTNPTCCSWINLTLSGVFLLSLTRSRHSDASNRGSA